MTDKAALDAALAAAAGSEAALEAIAAGPLGRLPPVTALGINRRLHAALLRAAKRRGDAVARAGLQAHLVPPPVALGPLADGGAALRRAMVAAAAWPVPRVLHQIWIGPRPLPPTMSAWAAHARAHGWAHRLWREGDLAAAGHDGGAVFAARMAAGDLPGAADAARYALLAAEGGVYLDADWYPGRADLPLDAAIPMAGLAAPAEEVGRLTGRGMLLLANSVIAAAPGHPALRHLLAVLPAAQAAIPGAPAWWTTGPLIFTLVARQGPVTVLDAGLIGAPLPPAATLAEAAARAAEEQAQDGGPLIPWKPWSA